MNLDTTFTVRFDGIELTGYLDSSTGKVSVIVPINKDFDGLKEFDDIPALIKYYKEVA